MRLLDWFRSAKRQDTPTEEWWEGLRRLEGDMKQLELEWEQTYGMVRRALATLAKRQKREEESRTEPAEIDQHRKAGVPSDYAEAVRLGFFER